MTQPKFDPIQIAKDELADAIRLRDEAQARWTQAQQVMQQAQNDVVGYGYAAKQCEAFIKLLNGGIIAHVEAAIETSKETL